MNIPKDIIIRSYFAFTYIWLKVVKFNINVVPQAMPFLLRDFSGNLIVLHNQMTLLFIFCRWKQ